MKAAVAIAGFTPAEADGLRRAMTKARSTGEMEALRERFVAGARASGLSGPVAVALFDSLAKFSGFGFCKAHAATYGEFSYQAAYLKAHFPAEFIAAVLVNDAGFYHPSVYIEEAKRLGVPVALPDINRSAPDFHVAGGVLYFGLGRIKGMACTTVEAIMEAREKFPFVSLSDFLSRVETTEEEVATLVKCGAFDSFDNTRPELLWKLAMTYPQARAAGGSRRGGCEERGGCAAAADSLSLPLNIPRVLPAAPLPRLPDYTPMQKLRMELEYLEASVTSHPLEILVPDEMAHAAVRSRDLGGHLGETVSLVGWVIAQRRAVTRKREYMEFLTLEDLTGTFEATLFPREYERLGALIGMSRILRVTGLVSDRAGGISLIASDLEPLAV